MSVRFRLVNMLDSRVSNRLPTACQKNSTRRAPPWKRDPYTASARPSRIGSSNLTSSPGSYSRSASWATTTCPVVAARSEEHTSELQSPCNLVCRLLLEKKKKQHTHKRNDPTHCTQ